MSKIVKIKKKHETMTKPFLEHGRET